MLAIMKCVSSVNRGKTYPDTRLRLILLKPHARDKRERKLEYPFFIAVLTVPPNSVLAKPSGGNPQDPQ